MSHNDNGRLPFFLLIALIPVFIWSGAAPKDRLTWVLEVLPVIIGFFILLFTFHRFRLTPLAYILIWVHAVILLVGGHYTYAEVPLFDWIRDSFGLSRNHYDRLGHLAQGFVPAIITREVLLRKSPLERGGWLFFLTVSVCLSISAFYELIEWWTALLSEEAAAAFLGSQGDAWDAQWDMFLALAGAIFSLLSLGPLHDRQLKKITEAGHE